VLFHTVLCHVERVEQALAEAHRVCRPGGTLAVFDGDYATATVATAEHDPLQACMDATVEHLVHDPWLVRRLPRLIAEAGFELLQVDGHAYTTTGSEYMTSIVERGADALAAAGTVDARTADALKAEAAVRVASGRFFGHIAYASALARR
jgi:SAM-dependent methyltransferase